MNEEIYEEYEKLKSKYDLPSFKVMDNELELTGLDSADFLLRKIRRRMNDKLVFYCRVIEGVLFPNGQSLVNMQESKFFTDKDKEEIAVVYGKMMVLERRALKLDVVPNDKEEVVLINDMFKDWSGFGKKLSWLAEKMRDGWKEKVVSGKEEGYFG